MNKLIKLSETQYIVVDSSEIKENDYYYLKKVSSIIGSPSGVYKSGNKIVSKANTLADNCFKITHSTEPLEAPVTINGFDSYDFISLSEVEEVINRYSVEKMVKNAYIKHSVKDDKLSLDEQIQRSGGFNIGYKEGFKAHQELVKDKVFDEEDMRNAIQFGLDGMYGYKLGEDGHTEIQKSKYIQSLRPTEWECIIDEQGKINIDE